MPSNTDLERAYYAAALDKTDAEVASMTSAQLRAGFIAKGIGRTDVGWRPADSGWLAATYDPVGISSTTIIGTTAHGSRLWLPSGMLLSNIVLSVATAGATLTAGQNGLAIYSPSGALLARTVDATADFGVAGPKAIALETPTKTVEEGLHDIVVWSNGTTKVTLHRSISVNAPNVTQIRSFTIPNITTTPPNPLPARTAISTHYWFGLT